jgi:hypothetical protein
MPFKKSSLIVQTYNNKGEKNNINLVSDNLKS